jgi:hypothetical protein
MSIDLRKKTPGFILCGLIVTSTILGSSELNGMFRQGDAGTTEFYL